MTQKKKSVTFHSICYIYLIPHKNEYSNIKDQLWWNSFDYMIFRTNFNLNQYSDLLLNNQNTQHIKLI
jgi:hypothetical protein